MQQFLQAYINIYIIFIFIFVCICIYICTTYWQCRGFKDEVTDAAAWAAACFATELTLSSLQAWSPPSFSLFSAHFQDHRSYSLLQTHCHAHTHSFQSKGISIAECSQLSGIWQSHLKYKQAAPSWLPNQMISDMHHLYWNLIAVNICWQIGGARA